MKFTLRSIREAKGYSKSVVSLRCSVGIKELTEAEENPDKITASLAFKLRKLYNVPLDYIDIN